MKKRYTHLEQKELENAFKLIGSPPKPPPNRVIKEDVPFGVFYGVFLIVFFGVCILCAGFFAQYMDEKWHDENPIECVDGYQYHMNKESGNKIKIVLQNDLPVKCKE